MVNFLSYTHKQSCFLSSDSSVLLLMPKQDPPDRVFHLLMACVQQHLSKTFLKLFEKCFSARINPIPFVTAAFYLETLLKFNQEMFLSVDPRNQKGEVRLPVYLLDIAKITTRYLVRICWIRLEDGRRRKWYDMMEDDDSLIMSGLYRWWKQSSWMNIKGVVRSKRMVWLCFILGR